MNGSWNFPYSRPSAVQKNVFGILLIQLGKRNRDISKTHPVFLPPGTHIIISPGMQAVPNSSFTLNLLPGHGLPKPKSVTPNKLDNVSVLGGIFAFSEILCSKKYNAFLLIFEQ